jgi:hypothetical protein
MGRAKDKDVATIARAVNQRNWGVSLNLDERTRRLIICPFQLDTDPESQRMYVLGTLPIEETRHYIQSLTCFD